MDGRTYIAIDLKSFYASVECAKRKLDPMTTNLVVADASRTEKTICLAVSPALKAHGIPGRARLFEVVQRVKEVNAQRRARAPGGVFTGSSCNSTELEASPSLSLDFITATPQMAKYIACSTEIYNIYLRYVSPGDIHVYSIDEVFIDATNYLQTYGCSARELTKRMVLDIKDKTQIIATAGIGTNLYLSKVAMDIGAKHIPPDEDGVYIAELDELSYRRSLWTHRPITDFWRIGRGYAKKLEENGLFTMGDVARCSIGRFTDFHNEALLYRLFGVNAELLIDHAWGWEPCTIADIKSRKPSTSSLGAGQVLHSPYPFDRARVIIREMTDALVLDLVDKGLVTDQMVLSVGYDIDSLKDEGRAKEYQGPVTTDFYGRSVPKAAHGSINLGRFTSSTRRIMDAMTELFDRIVDEHLLVRRVAIAANHVVDEASAPQLAAFAQLDLFTDHEAVQAQEAEENAALAREKRLQKAVLSITKKYGKNALLKGMNFEEGATTMDRNNQIGGHKA